MTTQSSELRLRALARLATSSSPEAKVALDSAFRAAVEGLQADSAFTKLTAHLDVLETIGYAHSGEAVEALGQFLKNIESKPLEYEEPYKTHATDDFCSSIYGPEALVIKAITALSRLRYLHPRGVLSLLLPLTTRGKDAPRKKAIEELEKLASYDLAVFYGTDRTPGIGPYPQLEALSYLETLGNAEIQTYFDAIVAQLSKFLSETMRGTEWSYGNVTLSQAPVPGNAQVADVRRRSIAWTKSIYASSKTLGQRLALLSVLNGATRSSRGRGPDSAQMIADGTVEILEFYKSLVDSEPLVIVEKLESYAYWIHYHSPSEVVQKVALQFRDVADRNTEYQIFKVLIGFEGIFTDWGRHKSDDDKFSRIDAYRKDKALSFVNSVSPKTLPEWKDRILRYSTVESQDLATFPTFVFFLEKIGELQPELAHSLMEQHSDAMNRFLSPLLRGTFIAGRHEAFRRLIKDWTSGGQHLLQCAYVLDSPETFDASLLLLVLEKATEKQEIRTITIIMGAAATGYADSQTALQAQELFLRGLEVLSRQESAAWIFELWFRPQTRKLLRSFDKQRTDLVLANLLYFPEIDYHAEEVLYILASEHPIDVIRFFIARADAGRAMKRSMFEAIPFELHKLDKALAPYATQAVAAVRDLYEGDYSAMMDNGARLLKLIYPTFPESFEAALLALVETGKLRDIEFVLAVLRNYEGQSFLARICMAIVDALPVDAPLLDEVAVVLESTGVVVGEFGFAEALEAKKAQAATWTESPSEKIKQFSANYIQSLDTRIIEERARATERLVLRKASFGQYD